MLINNDSINLKNFKFQNKHSILNKKLYEKQTNRILFKIYKLFTQVFIKFFAQTLQKLLYFHSFFCLAIDLNF